MFGRHDLFKLRATHEHRVVIGWSRVHGRSRVHGLATRVVGVAILSVHAGLGGTPQLGGSARRCVDEGQPVDGVQRSQVSERLCCQSMECRAHRCRLAGQHESRGENPGVRQRRRGAAMAGASGDVVRLLCQVLPFASVWKSARCDLSN